MSFGAIVVLAIGVAMDAMAVAAARGLAAPVVRIRDGFMVGVLFGGAQAGMPLLGWVVGSRVGPLVSRWDHWIAFGLLSAIGARMLWEARPAAADKGSAPPTDPLRLRLLLVLALATSIDAFAVGITLPMLDAPLLLSIVTIGVVTAVLSGLALFAGRRVGARFGRRIDALGGLMLIGLALKILLEHLLTGRGT